MMNTAPNDTPHAAVTPPLQTPRGDSRPVVLVAEDDRSVRRYLEIILQRAGFQVIAAADGLEAMKAALSATVDAVVTDANMPHLSGYELCRFLRRHPKLARLPVVLLSGSESPAEPPDEAERADAYLSKPVRPEDLADCLSRLLPARAA
jgi:CheY-like chemotaxis protein